MIEVAGGTDMVRKTITAFLPDKASTCVLVDLHGYDAWPALAALEVDVLVFTTGGISMKLKVQNSFKSKFNCCASIMFQLPLPSLELFSRGLST